MAAKAYSYSDSLKSDLSDEPINLYLQRPLAGILVRLLFRTAVTPNELTIAGAVSGVAGALLIPFGGHMFWAAAALLYLKDILDSADGQLARAKQRYSRRGRFLDSIGDFAVNLFLFGGIGTLLVRLGYPSGIVLVGSLVGFLGVTLRVSYHVFYQTAYLHTFKEYQTNRLTEELREEDYAQDPVTRRLQQTFQILYGWQDRLMTRIDGVSRKGVDRVSEWYRDPAGLRLGGFLGLGTEYVMLTICLIVKNPQAYLLGSVVVLNGLWMLTMAYRKFVVAGKLLE